MQGASFFRSFGSVVNLNPGGFFGVEGQGLLGGEGQGTGAGSSRADGVTILSSKGSMSLWSSSGSLARGEDGESPFLPSSRDGSRRDAQSPAWLDSGLSKVTLGDEEASHQLPKIIRRKIEKTFSLLPFDLQEVMDGGTDFICCGVVGEGSRFCSKLAGNCIVRDHCSRKKMYDAMEMEDGFYISDAGVGRAFGEPCLPLVAAPRRWRG